MAHLWTCVQATLWLGSWLRGAAPADDVLDAIAATDPALAQQLLPGDDSGQAQPFIAALGAIRAAGATSAWLAAPRPGAPDRLLGLDTGVLLARGGPGGMTAVAELRPAAPAWRLTVLADPPGCEHVLAGALSPAMGLERLKGSMLAARAPLAAAAREIAPDDIALQLARPKARRARSPFPPDLDPRRVEYVELALHVLDMAELGTRDDAATVSAAEIAARRGTLSQFSGEVTDTLVGLVNGANLADGRSDNR